MKAEIAADRRDRVVKKAVSQGAITPQRAAVENEITAHRSTMQNRQGNGPAGVPADGAVDDAKKKVNANNNRSGAAEKNAIRAARQAMGL